MGVVSCGAGFGHVISPHCPLRCRVWLLFRRVSLETGTEEWNTIEGNLGVRCRGTALMEPSDVTPGIFHVRNPNNFVRFVGPGQPLVVKCAAPSLQGAAPARMHNG
jgi:hypothetical protein